MKITRKAAQEEIRCAVALHAVASAEDVPCGGGGVDGGEPPGGKEQPSVWV